jgi:phosphoribosylamine--glycine ligase
MGAYSPAPVVTPDVYDRVMTEVIGPTIRGMASDGAAYTGFLYAGLMIMPDGAPKVIEFNCRFGDPEAQPVLMRLKSDLVTLCDQAIDGELAGVTLDWDPRASLGVVMAAGGYPESYRKGDVIHGLDETGGLEAIGSDALKVFHAGTTISGGNVVTNGGRVLCVVGLGDDVAAAQAKAYEGVRAIDWQDRYFRTDIGHRATSRG